MDTRSTKLIFVYNADADLFSQVSDFVHKIVSPDTYTCNLCKLTYGNVTMKKEWEEFIEQLPQEAEFLHRDELERQYPEMKNTPLPTVLAKKGDEVIVLITAKEINQQSSIKELKKLINSKLAT